MCTDSWVEVEYDAENRATKIDAVGVVGFPCGPG